MVESNPKGSLARLPIRERLRVNMNGGPKDDKRCICDNRNRAVIAGGMILAIPLAIKLLGLPVGESGIYVLSTLYLVEFIRQALLGSERPSS